MSGSEHDGRALRVAGAALLAVVSVWAGVRLYSSRAAHLHTSAKRLHALPPDTVRTPVGEASAPAASDFDAPFSSSPLPGPLALTIPEHLPVFSLADRAGNATPIARWAGKSLILNFWATWCAPCRREIPLLKSLSTHWGGRDLEVIGIAVDDRDKVIAYADEFKIAYPLLIGEQDALDVAAQFGMASPVFPFSVFTDRSGEVVTLYVGELHQAQADLILTQVDKLNHQQVDLAQAQHAIADGLHALGPDSAG